MEEPDPDTIEAIEELTSLEDIDISHKKEAFEELHELLKSLIEMATKLEALVNEEEKAEKIKKQYAKLVKEINSSNVFRRFLKLIYSYRCLLDNEDIDMAEHDMNNTFSNISNFISIVDSAENDEAKLQKIKRFALRFRDVFEKLDELIKSFKATTRSLSTKKFSPLDVLKTTNLHLVSSNLPQGLELEFDFHKEKFLLMVREIMTNAAKYSQEDNVRVDLTTEIDLNSRLLTLAFKDYGIGISKSDLKKLKKGLSDGKKYRAHKHIKGDGFGLLSMSKYCTVKVESEGEDLGTTVTLKIPFKEPKES